MDLSYTTIAGSLFAIGTSFYLLKQLLRKSIKNTFKNKKIIITGASAGIGKALTYQLASYNTEICIVARREDRLLELQKDLNNKFPNTKIYVIIGDISTKDQCKYIINKSIEFMNGIDVLLLNAGIGCLIRLDKTPEEDLGICERVMNINYFANVYLTYYALPYLKKSKGMIIVNSSLAGIGWSPTRCFYSASKHALRGFYNSLRCEVGNDIQITIVYPGFVLTEIHDRAYHEDGKPLARGKGFMTAERCAELILRGARDGARDYCMTWLGSIALKTNPFMGSINDKIAIKKANAGISQ